MNILSYFSNEEVYIIDLLKIYCINNNTRAYLIGGVVRDFLLNKKSKDIDICIECDPMEFIESIEYIQDYKYHNKFQTSTILFKNEVKMDLIRCRREEYDFNGALPKIIPSNIYDDLYRRDFTINAIAYDIIDNKIIDPYNGVKDVKKGIIKEVHTNSYEEDPTRIFRGIKYSNRYNFSIEDIDKISHCIKNNVFKTISRDRTMKELLLLCNEENWVDNILSCHELGIVGIDGKFVNRQSKLIDYSILDDRILAFYISIREDDEYRRLFINNSVLKKGLRSAFKNFEKYNNTLNKLIHKNTDNSDIYKILNSVSCIELKLFSFNKLYKYIIMNYIDNLKDISVKINDSDLKELALEKGKEYKKILNHLLKIKLNIGVLNEEKYIRKKMGEILNVIKYKD